MKLKLRKYARKEARRMKKQAKHERFSKRKVENTSLDEGEFDEQGNYEEGFEDEFGFDENEEYDEEEHEVEQVDEEIVERKKGKGKVKEEIEGKGKGKNKKSNKRNEEECEYEEIDQDQGTKRIKKSDLPKIDLEIMELEERLGLRGSTTKMREKNWRKVKKQLELDGLGADFYDILDGKSHDPLDDESISAPDSPELELVGPSDQYEGEEGGGDEGEDDFGHSGFEEDEEDMNEPHNDIQSDDSLPKKRNHPSSPPAERNPVLIYSDPTKKIKGLLNRLSDQNIEPITRQITELFKTNSNSSLLDSFWDFLQSLFSSSSIATQLLAVYATEISALSRFVGREVSAYMLEKLYSTKESFTMSQVEFVAYLYYFGVISVDIIKGFIHFYIDDLSENNVEFLIHTFNIIGFTLRKKQGNVLKELIQTTQEKFKLSQNPSIRYKVLIENLLDIKNNKKKQNLVEERLKFLKNYLKNSVIKVSGIKENEICTSFQEISSGKWRDLLKPSFASTSQKEKFAPEIEKLAREQKMNTESRRQIFCLIMTAEDYMDAYAKLSNLKKQERDIVRVIIICAGQENVYNKFYALIAAQLCKHKSSFKYSFQYALWDNLKEFEEFSIRKISNIAKFFAELIAGQSLDLAVLKAVSFDEVNEHLSIFLRILLENVFVCSPVQVVGMIFEKVGSNDKLAGFAEGLRVFIKMTILKHPRKGVTSEIGVENFLNRVKVARKALKSSS